MSPYYLSKAYITNNVTDQEGDKNSNFRNLLKDITVIAVLNHKVT